MVGTGFERDMWRVAGASQDGADAAVSDWTADPPHPEARNLDSEIWGKGLSSSEVRDYFFSVKSRNRLRWGD